MSKFDVKNFQNPYIVDLEDFVLQYKESIQNPSSFFLKKAISYLSWFKEPTVGHNGSFEETKWFEDGTLNISYNCIDRHAPSEDILTRRETARKIKSQV
jgi:acetyl-CoA synthetase